MPADLGRATKAPIDNLKSWKEEFGLIGFMKFRFNLFVS